MPKLRSTKPKARAANSGARPRSNARTPARSLAGPDTAHHEALLVGLTDPFSPEAASAQYPDSGAGRSLSFQHRVAVPYSTDANGALAFVVNPRVSFPFLNYTTIVAGGVTWAATWNRDFASNLVNQYGRTYRPISFGLRISNTLSATESAGYIVIAKGGSPPLAGSTNFIPTNFTSWDSHPLSHGGEWHVVGCPRSANAYDMRDIQITQANNTAADGEWESLYVAVFGSKALASIIYVELYINYEYITREDAEIAQLARPQPVLNTQMQTAINHVQSNHLPSHKGGTAAVSNFIKREGKKALIKHVIPFITKKAVQALV